MKKVFLFIAVCALIVSQTKAQESSFQQNDNVVSVGIGLGGTLYSGWGYSGIKRIPTISLGYERCIIGELFDDKSAIGVGGILGYTSAKYDVSGWGWKSTDIMVGARGAFHYAFVDKLDTYAGFMLGYNVHSRTYTGDGGHLTYKATGSSGLASSFFAGGRYYLADTFAVFAEVGYGYSFLNAGISLKF